MCNVVQVSRKLLCIPLCICIIVVLGVVLDGRVRSEGFRRAYGISSINNVCAANWYISVGEMQNEKRRFPSSAIQPSPLDVEIELRM